MLNAKLTLTALEGRWTPAAAIPADSNALINGYEMNVGVVLPPSPPTPPPPPTTPVGVTPVPPTPPPAEGTI